MIRSVQLALFGGGGVGVGVGVGGRASHKDGCKGDCLR